MTSPPPSFAPRGVEPFGLPVEEVVEVIAAKALSDACKATLITTNAAVENAAAKANGGSLYRESPTRAASAYKMTARVLETTAERKATRTANSAA